MIGQGASNMRKLVFKKWLDYVIRFITFGAFIFMLFEHEDLKVYIIKNIICIIILLVNIKLLEKYGRNGD